MAIKSYIKGGTTATPFNRIGKFVLHELEIDFAVAANNLPANDVAAWLQIIPNTLVLGVSCEVITAEGTAGTATVGDGSDVDGWIKSVDVNATGNIKSSSASTVDTTTSTAAQASDYADAYMKTGGKFYTAADTIDLIPSIILDVAKIKLRYWGMVFE